jgi:geranylgeranyl pyrophosphate synthase
MNNNGSGSDVIAALGFTAEMNALSDRIAAWLHQTDPEMTEALNWQFRTGSKYFRPLTMFACHRSIMPIPATGAIPPEVMTAALVVEMMHNMTLVVDDILDRSDTRRACQIRRIERIDDLGLHRRGRL